MPTPPMRRSRPWVCGRSVARMSDSDIRGFLEYPHVAIAHAGYDTEPADQTLDDRADGVIPILRAGVLARQFRATAARAKVEAVFERSFYLRSGDTFICVGTP